MKKFIFTSFILFTLTLSSIIGVRAAPVYDDFDFTVYDNEKYDLLTGFKSTDENYSITNKIYLDKDLIGDEVVFSHDDFHHVLFFNEYNAYIGYVNTDKNDLQLDTWINNDVATDGTLIIPDGVDKIALMNYNYGAFRDDIIYTNEDIDNIAWDSLSYRDIFEGNNLIVNSTFETVDNWSCFICTLTIDNNAGLVTPNGTANDLYFYPLAVTGLITDTNTYFVSVDTLYPTSYDNFIINLESWTLTYNDLTYTDDITEITTFSDNFTAQKDSDYIYFHFNKSTVITAVETIFIDNIYLYDLTAIFTSNLPTAIEFETMKLYYDTYINAVAEISYNDIFGNNLIENGNFDNDLSGWSYIDFNGLYGTVFENKSARLRSDGTYTTFIQSMTGDFILDDILYYSFSYNSIEVGTPQFNIYAPTGVITVQKIIPFGSDIITDIVVSSGDAYSFYFKRSGVTDIYLDNIRVFNLTAIFGYVEDDVTTTWIEARYDEWVDPLGDAFIEYYPAANLITLDIDYSWDDTPADDPDAITSIDESLVKMGVISDELKVFLAFTIMIIAAISIGLATHNSTFIILAEVVLIIIFTMMGWFSFWILLLIALIFTLLILRNGLKGGNKQ